MFDILYLFQKFLREILLRLHQNQLIVFVYKNLFKDIQWQLIDERLSSKHANNLKKATTIEEKIKSHAIVAAMLLDSYLQFLDNDAF